MSKNLKKKLTERELTIRNIIKKLDTLRDELVSEIVQSQEEIRAIELKENGITNKSIGF